jgi:hypothetical protein
MSGDRYPCCRHCDPGDDWHVTRGRGAHRDACPQECGGAVHLGCGTSPRCGNPGWSLLTADGGCAVTCRTCLNLMAGTGNRFDVKGCPSEAAYRREMRRGGAVHPWCREAANRERADQRRGQKELAA